MKGYGMRACLFGVVLLWALARPAVADLDFSDSSSFPLDSRLVSPRHADSSGFPLDSRRFSVEFFESSAFGLDLTRVNRAWADSASFEAAGSTPDRIEIYDNEWSVPQDSLLVIRGRVVSADGTPLASVFIDVEDPIVMGSILNAAMTDNEGEFTYAGWTLGMPPKLYGFVFWAGSTFKRVTIAVRPSVPPDVTLATYELPIGARMTALEPPGVLLCQRGPSEVNPAGPPKQRTNAAIGFMRSVGDFALDWFKVVASDRGVQIGSLLVATCFIPTGVTQATTCPAGIAIVTGSVAKDTVVTGAHYITDELPIDDLEKEDLHTDIEYGSVLWSVVTLKDTGSTLQTIEAISSVSTGAASLFAHPSGDYIVLAGSNEQLTQAFCLWRVDECFFNEPPAMLYLPDRSLVQNESLDNTTDLWAYGVDKETFLGGLPFSIEGVSDPNCGVTIDANRYIDVEPVPDWFGICEVTVQVMDPCGGTDSATFTVEVMEEADGAALPSQVVPHSQSVVGDGEVQRSTEAGRVSFTVHIGGNQATPWSAEVIDGADWLGILSGAGGEGSGLVVVGYDSNTSGMAREGTIRVTAPEETDSPWDVTVIQKEASSGTLRIGLYPESAAASGARWRLDGGPWLESGAVVAGLLPGTYTIDYAAAPARITPPSEPVTIVDPSTVIARYYRGDCNENGTADEEDVAGGTSLDCNASRIPDECETLVPVDFDLDGRGDLEDYGAFAVSMAGPGGAPDPPQAACVGAYLEAFDLDGDGDIDLLDFASFQIAFAGP